MPPRKRYSKATPSASTSYSHEIRNARIHPTRSSAVQSESARCNGPVTRSLARARARSRSDAAAVAKSPIRSLPLEVLAEIFILAMHTECVEVHPKESLNRSEIESRQKMLLNPLVLCSVCSSWRVLAFSIAELWTRVFVHIPSGLSEAKAKCNAAGLVRWIKRSHTRPLMLYIFCDDSVPLDGTGPEAPIVSVLNDYASRWEALYLQPTVNPHESLQRPLHLFRFDGWHSLRRLCSPNWHRPLHKNESIPWAQLTHLQIHPFLTASEATIVFKECPKLVQLSITVGIGLMTAPIIMHDLVSLSLKTYRLSNVMNSLSLPSLRDVYITGLATFDLEPLSNLFTRSSCTLDKLGLCASPRDQLNLLGHRSCDSLTSLKLQGPWSRLSAPVSNEVLRRFTLHETDTLCPRLKYLTLDSLMECSVSALQKMVESRNGSPDCQRRDELLQYLSLRLTRRSNKLDKFGKGCGMEYTRQRHDRDHHHQRRFYSVSFRRRDLSSTQLRINHSGFCFDQD